MKDQQEVQPGPSTVPGIVAKPDLTFADAIAIAEETAALCACTREKDVELGALKIVAALGRKARTRPAPSAVNETEVVLAGIASVQVVAYASPTNGGYVGEVRFPGNRTVFVGAAGDLSFTDNGTNVNTALAPALTA